MLIHLLLALILGAAPQDAKLIQNGRSSESASDLCNFAKVYRLQAIADCGGGTVNVEQ